MYQKKNKKADGLSILAPLFFPMYAHAYIILKFPHFCPLASPSLAAAELWLVKYVLT